MATTIPKFCPECGQPLNGKSVCENCGYNVDTAATTAPNEPKTQTHTQTNTEATKKPTSTAQRQNSSWPSLEKWVVLAGTWTFWITLAISVILTLIYFILLVLSFFSAYWWSFISPLIAIVLTFVFLKPFSEKVRMHDWKFIVNDVVVIGNIRIPKCIIISVVMAIFLQGWGSLLMVFTTVCIIFFGPVPVEWKVKS